MTYFVKFCFDTWKMELFYLLAVAVDKIKHKFAFICSFYDLSSLLKEISAGPIDMQFI